jgi:hypothetical protein
MIDIASKPDMAQMPECDLPVREEIRAMVWGPMAIGALAACAVIALIVAL